MKNFIFTIILLGIIIYFSGGISTDKLTSIQQKQNNYISKQTSQVSRKTQPEKRSSEYNKPVSSASYSRFNPQPIPQDVILAAREFNYAYFLFNRSGKVLYYTYAPGSTCPYSGQKFHDDIIYLRASGDINNYYNFNPVTIPFINNISKAASAKVDNAANACKSDYNCLKNKSDSFNSISEFMSNCSIRKICIINNSKNEYVVIDRNIQRASEALNALKNW